MRKLFIICLLVASMAGQAQHRIYTLDTTRQIHDLRQWTYLLVDSSQKLSVADVTSGKMDGRFVELSSQKDDYIENAPYWLKFYVRALTDVNNWNLLLRDHYPYSGYTSQQGNIDVYYTDGNGKIVKLEKTGISVPRSEKRLQSTAGFGGVYFSAAPSQVQAVYIRVANEFSDKAAVSFPEIRDPKVPVPDVSFGKTIIVICTVALVFAILSFFFFLFVKERAYMYFSIYAFILSQHYLILHYDLPFVNFYIPEIPQIAIPLFTLLGTTSLLFFFLFGRSFVQMNTLSPRTDRWMKWFLVAWAAGSVLEVCLMMITRKYVLSPPIFLVLMPVGLGLIIRIAFFKSTLARIYVAGACWLIVFTILGFANNSGIDIGFNPWPIGQMGQLFIFGFGLAYKIRQNEKARAEAQRIQEMDQIKSRFFANISHEFRTPLTLIQGPLQQIEERMHPKDPSVDVPSRHVKTMRRNTDRLLELVNQLLDLSKLDSGKMKLQVIKGDVMQLLKALTASFESVAERKSIHYRAHFPTQSLICFFDKDKLEKIFSNLLSNAFKYTTEGGTVSVTVELEDHRLRMSVEDNGPGIPRQELDKIFDRFYQMEGTEDKGSGIGLALVKELVNLYRGQISVSSEPGKGSRFRVTVPVDRNLFSEEELVYGRWIGEESFVNKAIEDSEQVSVLKHNDSNLPLALIVEDNNDLRAFIVETITGHYQVLEARNGQEGLEKAIAEIPDIVVSDVMMPVMDGFTLAEKLKKDDRTSHIPVILLTAKAGQSHKLEGLHTGADDYLTKPFDAPELVLRMQNLISQRRLLRKKFAGEIILKPSEIAVTSAADQFLQRLMEAVEKNMGEDDFGVEELAKEVAMSRSQLHRKLVAMTGKSPSEVLRNTRLLRAKELLQKRSATPSEVAFKVGFNSHAYFSKCFKEEFGMSPSEI